MPGEILVTTVVFILGLVLGFIFDRFSRHHVGSFVINYSNPDTDLVKVELEEDLDYLDRQKTIEFDVKVIR